MCDLDLFFNESMSEAAAGLSNFLAKNGLSSSCFPSDLLSTRSDRGKAADATLVLFGGRADEAVRSAENWQLPARSLLIVVSNDHSINVDLVPGRTVNTFQVPVWSEQWATVAGHVAVEFVSGSDGCGDADGVPWSRPATDLEEMT